MNPDAIQRYISLIDKYYKKYPRPDDKEIDILEQFAWKEHLSAYDLKTRLNSMDIKMAYKNVNRRVHALSSVELIYQIKNINNNKRKARYYKLTEYGIFQLVLNKPNSLIFNQYDTRKSQAITFGYKTFFRRYLHAMLFETFLYPCFKTETLLAIDNFWFWDNLYHYLENCCHQVEYELKRTNIPQESEIFLWNDVPGKDEKKLLLRLKEMFNLKSVDFYSIKNEKDKKNTITINISTSSSIVLRLDKNRDKIVVKSIDYKTDQYKEFEYDVTWMGSEIIAVNSTTREESLKSSLINTAVNRLEQIIYQFVYELGLSTSDFNLKEKVSYSVKILSDDSKFMSVLERLYKDKHKGFEKGYQLLSQK